MKLIATFVGVIALFAGIVQSIERGADRSSDKAKSAEINKLIAAHPQQPNHGAISRSTQDDCTEILTCGARVQHWVNGEYTNRFETCNSRPTYQQTGTSQGTIYLYYWVGILGGVTRYLWILGDDVCGEVYYAAAFDTASTPDLITGTWLEYNYNTDTADENRGMSTQCVTDDYNECSSARPRGHMTSLGLLVGTLLFSMIVTKINIK